MCCKRQATQMCGKRRAKRVQHKAANTYVAKARHNLQPLHLLTVRHMTCRQTCRPLDCYSLSADCHDRAGHCVLRHCWEEYAVSVSPHLLRVAPGHLCTLWIVRLDRCLCCHPDDSLYGKSCPSAPLQSASCAHLPKYMQALLSMCFAVLLY